MPATLAAPERRETTAAACLGVAPMAVTRRRGVTATPTSRVRALTGAVSTTTAWRKRAVPMQRRLTMSRFAARGFVTSAMRTVTAKSGAGHRRRSTWSLMRRVPCSPLRRKRCHRSRFQCTMAPASRPYSPRPSHRPARDCSLRHLRQPADLHRRLPPHAPASCHHVHRSSFGPRRALPLARPPPRYSPRGHQPPRLTVPWRPPSRHPPLQRPPSRHPPLQRLALGHSPLGGPLPRHPLLGHPPTSRHPLPSQRLPAQPLSRGGAVRCCWRRYPPEDVTTTASPPRGQQQQHPPRL